MRERHLQVHHYYDRVGLELMNLGLDIGAGVQDIKTLTSKVEHLRLASDFIQGDFSRSRNSIF